MPVVGRPVVVLEVPSEEHPIAAVAKKTSHLRMLIPRTIIEERFILLDRSGVVDAFTAVENVLENVLRYCAIVALSATAAARN